MTFDHRLGNSTICTFATIYVFAKNKNSTHTNHVPISAAAPPWAWLLFTSCQQLRLPLPLPCRCLFSKRICILNLLCTAVASWDWLVKLHRGVGQVFVGAGRAKDLPAAQAVLPVREVLKRFAAGGVARVCAHN